MSLKPPNFVDVWAAPESPCCSTTGSFAPGSSTRRPGVARSPRQCPSSTTPGGAGWIGDVNFLELKKPKFANFLPKHIKILMTLSDSKFAKNQKDLPWPESFCVLNWDENGQQKATKNTRTFMRHLVVLPAAWRPQSHGLGIIGTYLSVSLVFFWFILYNRCFTMFQTLYPVHLKNSGHKDSCLLWSDGTFSWSQQKMAATGKSDIV